MTAPVSAPPVVALGDLRVGDLLAEGGEGRVHLLPRQPHLLLKSYRQAADRSHLEQLVAWPTGLTSRRAAATVDASAAWPRSVVAGADGAAVGLLIPRAPRRFSLRHKDGHSRLASLSYLTADPEHRAVAYGLQLPAAVSAGRVGIVYALARLLAAFDSGCPTVAHGDLSTKNVLWSLERGPEVFVIDCDNAERFGADGDPLGPAGRRRAMTPNWNDPAVPPGANPTPASDRYSLGLIFLRIVGAANFPIQARQRAGGPVEVRFPLPPGPGVAYLLDPRAAVWQVCARSLAVARPEERPPASAWLAPLEDLLTAMGAGDVIGRVQEAQTGVVSSSAEQGAWPVTPAPPTAPAAPDRPGGNGPADVQIVPEAAARPSRTFARVSPAPRYGPESSARPVTVGYRWAPVTPAPAAGGPAASRPAPRVWPEVRVQLVRFLRWWVAIHRSVGRPPRRLLRVLLCGAVDFAILVLGAAALALIVSPIIQG